MIELLQQYQVGLYICFFLLPFLQEDVSVLGAASACASGLANPFLGFVITALGLTSSASLKYGLGRAATSQDWAKKYGENPKMLKAGEFRRDICSGLPWCRLWLVSCFWRNCGR